MQNPLNGVVTGLTAEIIRGVTEEKDSYLNRKIGKMLQYCITYLKDLVHYAKSKRSVI